MRGDECPLLFTRGEVSWGHGTLLMDKTDSEEWVEGLGEREGERENVLNETGKLNCSSTSESGESYI